MGQQIAVNTGVGGVDLANINYGVVTSKLDDYMRKMGGGGARRENPFPGEQVSFKKGIYYVGFGEKKRTLKSGTRMIVNAPNMMAVWCTWKTSDGGKKYPVYTEPRFLALGDDPIDRASLGNTAEQFDLDGWKKGDPISEEAEDAGWEIDNYGNLQDPTKPVLVFPVRLETGEIVNHFMLSSVTSCIAGFNLYREIMDEMKLHNGQLPIVTFGGEKKTFKKTEIDKKGREKKVENTVDVPEFEIVGWVDAEDIDNPAKGGMRVTAENETADLGKVTAKSRVAGKTNGKANGKTKALAAPVKGKAKSRRTVEAVSADAPL